HPRDLHDPGFDRLDQREVTDHPREQGALAVAGSGQERRGGRQVVDRLDAELAGYRPQPSEPHPGSLRVGLGLRLLLGSQRLTDAGGGFGITTLVAVVCLVVEDNDLRGAAEITADPADHLALGFLEWAWTAGVPGQQLFGRLRDAPARLGLSQLQSVEV